MKILKAFLFIICIIAVSACGRDGYQYTGYRNIPSYGWAYGDKCEFIVNGNDSITYGHIVLSITNDNTYPFRNLWLEVSYPTERGIHLDTVNVELCDTYGNWYGNGLPGHYQLSDTVSDTPVSLRDSSLISVRHIMRTDTITGITQVGVSILQSN